MKKIISGGVYVIVDPGMKLKTILKQLEAIRDENIAAVQVWDNPAVEKIDENLVRNIIRLFGPGKTPVLINNKWELMSEMELDGVHFDVIPETFNKISQEIGRGFLKGVTVHNDLKVIQQAEQLNFDYVSFCSMFPSQTSNSCEIVQLKTVQRCREMTDMPIFLAGGITPQNIHLLNNLSFQGIAVVSAVMKANDPKKVLQEYNALLNQ